MNKRGQVAEGIDLLPFVVFLAIVGVGIVTGTTIFFGEELDYRIVESNQLVNVVKNCILEKGLVEGDLFYKQCRLNKHVLDKNHILKITGGGKEFQAGSNFEACDFIGAKRNRHYPRCAKRSFEVNGIEYEVVAGSNQWARHRRLLK